MAGEKSSKPAGVEKSMAAEAGEGAEESRLESASEVEMPNFDELQKNISETRKMAGPEIADDDDEEDDSRMELDDGADDEESTEPS